MSMFRKIVERESSKYELLMEDARADRELFELAFDVFDGIKKRAKNKATEVKPKLKDGMLVFNDNIEDLTLFRVDTKYGPFDLVVTSSADDSTTRGTWSEINKLMELNLHNIFRFRSEDDISNLDDEDDFNDDEVHQVYDEITQTYVDAMYVDDYIGYLCDNWTFRTFLHEFTHFVDHAKKRTVSQPNREYYNRDIEKNAWFMGKLFDVTSELIHEYGKALKDMTPDERLSFLKNKWNKDEYFMSYYNKLQPDYQKRFLSRLYSYFSTDHWNKQAA